MKKLTKASFWIGIIEQMVYICPTLVTVLYYYFAEIQSAVSKSSQYTFGLAIALFVFFLVYKHFAKTKLDELRQSVVQTETDLKNSPSSDTERIAKLAENARKDRTKLDTMDRLQVLICLVIFALAIYILEQATIGLTSIALIATASVGLGAGVHLGVLKLKQNEATLKPKKARIKSK